jgi:hypothetical protein
VAVRHTLAIVAGGGSSTLQQLRNYQPRFGDGVFVVQHPVEVVG